jgi:hypothetical protein
MDARTWYPLPRIRPIVFAFAGDSTITTFFPSDINKIPELMISAAGQSQ